MSRFNSTGLNNFSTGIAVNSPGNALGKQLELAVPGLIKVYGVGRGSAQAKYLEFGSSYLLGDIGDKTSESVRNLLFGKKE